MNERRKHKRYKNFGDDEPLCAVFDSGTFGKLIDISKNGISIHLVGAARIEHETVLDIFKLCGTAVISDLKCKVVRRGTVELPENKLIPNNNELLCLSFINDELDNEYISTIIAKRRP